MDVHKAFEAVKIDEAEAVLRESVASPIGLFNLVRELSNTEGTVKVPGLGVSEGFGITSAGRPGFRSWPKFWTLVVEVVMGPVVKRWREEEKGILVGKERISHRVWADNIFLTARSVEEAHAMATKLTTAFRARGYRMKPTSLEWLARKS